MNKTNELIGILEEQLRFIKMTVTEREYLENTIKKLKEAINYTRCSLQLKGLDNDNFEDWLIVNGYAVFDDYYLKNDIAFSESDLIEIYNKEVMNL